MNEKVVLITGAAKRVGAEIAKHLHSQGFRVIIHYGHSQKEAETLAHALNKHRENSAQCLQADLNNIDAIRTLAKQAITHWGRLDALINNASTFGHMPLNEINEAAWDTMINCNAKAPLFLCQAVADALKKQNGAIVNMLDMHVERPLKNYDVYSMAKAALAMLTKTLARSLAPEVRVNAIAPGIILWGENEKDFPDSRKQKIIERIPLQRQGTPQDIANACSFLLTQHYITGQTITIDGGRSLVL